MTFSAKAVACALFVAVLSAINGFSLDRESFSITKYDLSLQIDPEQHRLGVRGKITLRNDTAAPQKIAVLQVSSSLDWRSIKAGDKAVQYVTQPFTSDTDHTGALSEAIVTLPQAVPPNGTIELDVAYEGVVVRDATRLTRIGTPEDVAASADWDRISPAFTGLRGAGYVAWYPITTEVANLSEGNSVFDVLSRWKAREAGSQMILGLTVQQTDSFPVDAELLTKMLFNGVPCSAGGSERMAVEAKCLPQNLRNDTPSLLIADYQVLERSGIEIRFLRGHDASAVSFADGAEKALPLVTDWFGAQRERAKVADLADSDDASFESGNLLLVPLASVDSKLAGLAAVHQLTHASFLSFRPWIEEGLAHFAQTLFLEHEKGRQSAIDYMAVHRSALSQTGEGGTAPRADDAISQSLVSTTNEELYRSKAMCVWWMLRDMVGDSALKKALAAYHPEQDKEPSYMPHLISAQTQRDLEWFFDDWIYRDRGLPDFKVESAFVRKTMTNSFMLTITVDNLGTAGAEVPIIIKSAGGDLIRRLEVHAKDKATIRVETPSAPQEIQVNDGSVPESDVTNNSFKVTVSQN